MSRFSAAARIVAVTCAGIPTSPGPYIDPRVGGVHQLVPAYIERNPSSTRIASTRPSSSHAAICFCAFVHADRPITSTGALKLAQLET